MKSPWHCLGSIPDKMFNLNLIEPLVLNSSLWEIPGTKEQVKLDNENITRPIQTVRQSRHLAS